MIDGKKQMKVVYVVVNDPSVVIPILLSFHLCVENISGGELDIQRVRNGDTNGKR